MKTQPDPTLITLAGLVARSQDPDAVPPADWPAIITAALGHGLGPMLLWAVKQRAPDRVMEPLWTPLLTVARETATRHVWLESAQIQVNEALAAAAIPALWLKGIALARTVYPQPALRPMIDLDVLVPYNQRQEALAILLSQGYQRMVDEGPFFAGSAPLQEKLTHHYPLQHAGPPHITLELHYRFLRSWLAPEQLDWFWERAQRQDSGLVIPAPEAHLLYLCAHAILQHGESQIGLLHFFDLHSLVTQAALDWESVLSKAVALGWTYAVERALTLAAGYFATPVPPGVLHEMNRRRPPAEQAALVGAGGQQGQALHLLARASWSERLRLLPRLIVPSRAYMRRQHGIPPGGLLWPAYLRRWRRQTGSLLAWIRNRLRANS